VRQQVNLYQPMFRRQQKVFSAVTMLQIFGFFIVVLAAAYAYSAGKVKPFREELAKTDAEIKRLNTEIQARRAAMPGQAERKLLETQIARLTRELDHLRQVREALGQGRLGAAAGFSGYFEGLARGYIEGAWLTDINITRGGRWLSLSGRTVSPELVPLMISRLSAAEPFQKRRFNVLKLERPEADRGLLSFDIATGG
jgi:hypothetical protein